MKKFMTSLPARLLLAIVIGIVLGLIIPEAGWGASVMQIVVTLKYIMGQVINFCVPLIIIGFIAPSITKLGNSATKMLGVAIVIAYASSVLAAFMSMGAGFGIIPHLSIDSNVAGLREMPAGLPARHPPDHARYERPGVQRADRPGCRVDQGRRDLQRAG